MTVGVEQPVVVPPSAVVEGRTGHRGASRRCRAAPAAAGATFCPDQATMQPHADLWASLSDPGRLSSKEVTRLAQRLGTGLSASVVAIAPQRITAVR
jgi:hypothetical protein